MRGALLLGASAGMEKGCLGEGESAWLLPHKQQGAMGVLHMPKLSSEMAR